MIPLAIRLQQLRRQISSFVLEEEYEVLIQPKLIQAVFLTKGQPSPHLKEFRVLDLPHRRCW